MQPCSQPTLPRVLTDRVRGGRTRLELRRSPEHLQQLSVVDQSCNDHSNSSEPVPDGYQRPDVADPLLPAYTGDRQDSHEVTRGGVEDVGESVTHEKSKYCRLTRDTAEVCQP